MKKSPTPEKLLPVSSADLAFIRGLADSHCEGLEARCARHRRRADIVRLSMAACLFIGCCTAYTSLMAAPQYSQTTSNHDADPQHACDAVSQALDSL